MKYRKSTLLFLILISISLACSKSGAKKDIRALTSLEKKILGKWYFDNVSGFTGTTGYIEFYSTIVDSLSNDSTTFRTCQLVSPQSYCGVDGIWYCKEDSSMYTHCIGYTRLINLTDSNLIVRYYTNFLNLDYKWHR